jgi:hypothetical protein
MARVVFSPGMRVAGRNFAVLRQPLAPSAGRRDIGVFVRVNQIAWLPAADQAVLEEKHL